MCISKKHVWTAASKNRRTCFSKPANSASDRLIVNTSIWVLLTVFLYILSTAPFLPLLILTHRLRADNTPRIITGMALQIIPLGLVFLPLAVAGVAYLTFLLRESIKRNRQFEQSGLNHPDLWQKWRQETTLLWWAVGLAIQQKIIAWLFLDASARHLPGVQWIAAGVVSVGLWIVILFKTRRKLPIHSPDQRYV
jgi:hypothetical protein